MTTKKRRRDSDLTGDITEDLRAIHSRIYDGEEITEMHSKDIRAILGRIQEISKRLTEIEERRGMTDERPMD